MPRSAQILKMPGRLECSACGASTTASCDCDAPYVRAGQRAAIAVALHPEESNRAIADRLGVDESTIRAARKELTAGNPAVGKRLGKDGKLRRLPVKLEIMPSEEEADESWQQTLYDEACLLLERMADETRQRFFAHIKRKYHD